MKRQLKKILLKVYALYLSSAVGLARLRRKKIVFVPGTPLHSNLGDQAIALAEIEFIKLYMPKMAVVAIPKQFITQERVNIRPNLVHPDDIIIGLGGGNLGDIYMSEELCRRKFIQLFPENKIVIFPQTMHFTDTEFGQRELAKTKSIYSKHNHLTLIAREQTSYKMMKQTFTKNSVVLTPDIVLSTNKSATARRRNGLLLCLRQDKEANLSQKDRQAIKHFSRRHFKTVRRTDTISKQKLFFVRSKTAAIRSKLKEFRSAKLVITDRLHGMVFSAITGTPCIAMANFDHKIADTYRWISYLPYIKFCEHTSQLEALLKELDLSKAYSYTPDHFNNYWAKIKEILVSDAE